MIEANMPEDLWTVKRKSIEDFLISNITLNKKESILGIYHKYVAKLDEAREKGLGFLFTGPNGSGKTFIGCRILIEALSKNHSSHYIFFYDFIEMLKEFDDSFVYAVIDEMADVDFLFIDEIGKEYKTSQFVLTNLEKLLKERRSKNKPTFFATNLDIDGLRDTYGPSFMSLVEGRNLVIKFEEGAPDIRIRDGRPTLRKFFDA